MTRANESWWRKLALSLIRSCGVVILMGLLQGCFGVEVLITEMTIVDRPVVSMD